VCSSDLSKRLESLKEQITAYEDELDVYLKAQVPLMDQDLKNLQSLIRQRLLDDVRYSLEKEKKVPSPSRIRDITEKALRHGLLDIVRDYRYRLSVKMDKAEEVLLGQHPELFDRPVQSRHSFDSSFEKGFMVSNNEVLFSKLTKLLAKSSLKSLLKDDKQMAEIIQEEFIYLEGLTKRRALEVSRLLLDGLFAKMENSVDTLLKRMDTDEALLQACLSFIDEDEAIRTQRSLALHKKNKMIELIARRCQG